MDDLQVLWQEYDARLDAAMRLNALLVRRASLSGAQTALGRLAAGIRFEVAANALAVVLLGGFAAEALREPAVCAAAVVLDLYAIAALIAAIVQLAAVARIDYDEPVFAIARAVESLKLLRARTIVWTLGLAPLAWIPLLIVACWAFLGLDATSAFAAGWFAANGIIGVAIALLTFAAARFYAPRLATDSRLRRLLDVLSGASLCAAAQQVDTLERYDAEDARA